MPTQYTFTLPVPGSAAVGSTKRTYAFTRRVDPLTRDYVLKDSRYARGNPAVELVLWTLATPQGSYLPDPTLGPRYQVLDKARPNIQAAWKTEVENALARFIPTRLTKLRVEVDPPRKQQLLYSVSFVDPRSEDHLPISVPLVVKLAA